MTQENPRQDPLLETLKVLADESRLLLLRILHEGEYSVGDLAQRINLTEPTVSHHLARLREVELASLRMAGNQRFYRINAPGLNKFKQLVGVIEQLPVVPETPTSDNAWIAALGWEAEDQQVLRDHTTNGRISHLPTKHKKLLIILRWLASLFKADTFYTESEVNVILRAVYETDYVGLRRDLVDMGYLRRERGGGKYWLAPTTPEMTETESVT
jgi:DNA-binding transcriptional ArsR family regulator